MPGRLNIPRTNIGVATFAARRAIRPQTEDVDLTAQAGIQILIGMSPGIFRQTFNIATGFPVQRQRRTGRPFDECLQALFGGRILLVVEPV